MIAHVYSSLYGILFHPYDEMMLCSSLPIPGHPCTLDGVVFSYAPQGFRPPEKLSAPSSTTRHSWAVSISGNPSLIVSDHHSRKDTIIYRQA